VGTLFEEVVILDEGRLLLHEETEVLRARGASVTGPAALVDAFAEGLTVLSEQQLGPTKRAMVYGALDDLHREDARQAGLDLGPVALQDLFVHLTQPASGRSTGSAGPATSAGLRDPDTGGEAG
jgi:ABC-2 type transport system ATP-binding protein